MILISKTFDFAGSYSRRTIRDYLTKELVKPEVVLKSAHWVTDWCIHTAFTTFGEIPLYTSSIIFVITYQVDPLTTPIQHHEKIA